MLSKIFWGCSFVHVLVINVPPGMAVPTSCRVRTDSFSPVSTLMTPWHRFVILRTPRPAGLELPSWGLTENTCIQINERINMSICVARILCYHRHNIFPDFINNLELCSLASWSCKSSDKRGLIGWCTYYLAFSQSLIKVCASYIIM